MIERLLLGLVAAVVLGALAGALQCIIDGRLCK